MKKIIISLFVCALVFPVVSFAHTPEPAVIPDGPLSQYPITTSRPPVSVPTAPAGGSFSGSGGQCLQNFPWYPYAVTPCWLEIVGMIAGLK